MNGAVYIDGFCPEHSSATGQPASGPGQTTSQNLSLGVGQQGSMSLPISSNAMAISVVATSSGNLPLRLTLVSPTGSILRIADSSGGIAVLTAPTVGSGTYLVKVLNLSIGPETVWAAATPTVQR